ncbi:MAG: PAS domain-containing protein [Alphaproteobacteria bacterium]|nr:PAS domain-containing protein [Alphaproteobacteria bacterium]
MPTDQDGAVALLHYFVDQAPFPIAMFDREMRYLMYSRRWLTTYHLGDVDLRGRSHYEVFPDIQEEWRIIHRHCIEGSTAHCDADRFVRPDGQVQWLRWKIVPWRDGRGELGGVIMYTEDITEAVRHEKTIAESNRRFERLYNDTPALLFAIGADGRVTTASRTFLHRLGWRREQVLRRPFLDHVVATPESPEPKELLEQILVSPALEAVPLTLRSGLDELREMQLSTSQELTPEGQIERITCVFTDVTERNRAARALKERTRELVRSNEELEQFAYAASHDLQQPLRAIVGYAQLLERRHGEQLGDSSARTLSRLISRSLGMQQLIEDLLAYARVTSQPSAAEDVDVGPIVALAAENLTIAIEDSGAALRVEALPRVRGHRAQLVQLFQNLIGNAIKYRREVPPEVLITAARESGWWRFTVADNGMGFDPRYAEKIFLVFQRLHGADREKGSGIGLAIVKKVIDLHGGEIHAASTPGVGSRFIFTLPAAQEEARA